MLFYQKEMHIENYQSTESKLFSAGLGIVAYKSCLEHNVIKAKAWEARVKRKSQNKSWMLTNILCNSNSSL